MEMHGGSVDNVDDVTRRICGAEPPPPVTPTVTTKLRKPKRPLQQSIGAFFFDLIFGAAPATVLLPLVLFGAIIPTTAILALPGLTGIVGMWWTIMTTYKQKAPEIKFFQGATLVCGTIPASIMANVWTGLPRYALILVICIAVKRIYFLLKYA